MIFVSILLLTTLLLAAPPVQADWPMAGQNPQRTSHAPDTANPTGSCGYHAFQEYIPSKAQLITSAVTNLVYVPTAAGVYAIKPSDLTNSASDIVWFYQTPRPVGHSPTIDNATKVLYIPSLDHTIHAVNAQTGAFIWQSGQAGGSFVTSPVVANNFVYAGNRDGYMYAFNKTSGQLAWYYQTGGPIEYSAALNPENTILYFASNDMRAYALNAINGNLINRTDQYQGHGFHSFWPVYYSFPNQPTRVLFPKAANYPENFLSFKQQEAQLLENPNPLPITTFVAYHNKYPARETLLILDPQTLAKKETSPYLWWGNATGNRYPPAIDSQGRIWDLQNWYNTGTSPFGEGGFVSWYLGDSHQTFAGNYMRESGDEPRAFALFNNLIAFGHGGDGADTFGFAGMFTSAGRTWSNSNIRNTWGKWYEFWHWFKYGNWLNINYNDTGAIREWGSHYGSHGNQTPPIPLNNRAYIHRSNAVLCLQ